MRMFIFFRIHLYYDIFTFRHIAHDLLDYVFIMQI